MKGTVEEVDAKVAKIALGDGVMGHLRASEISRDRVEDARSVIKPGEELEARLTGIDRKTRVITLSIKEKEAHEEQQALQSYKSEASRPARSTTLGDLLKEQMSSEESSSSSSSDEESEEASEDTRED